MKALAFGALLVLCLTTGYTRAAEPTVASMPPVVVETMPVAGNTAVRPDTKEIRVTFSKDMKTENMWSFVQVSKKSYPKTTGKPRYVDKRTIVLPVELAANHTYVLWINRGRHNAFRDTGGHPAVPYLLVFETGENKESRP